MSPRVWGVSKRHCDNAAHQTLKEHVYQKVKQVLSEEENSHLVLTVTEQDVTKIDPDFDLAEAIQDEIRRPWEAGDLYTPAYGSTQYAIDSLVSGLDATTWKDDFEDSEWNSYKGSKQVLLRPDGTKCWRTKHDVVLIVPKKHVAQLCRLAHELVGHAGYERVLAELRKVVYWHGMRNDMKKYDGECGRCGVARHRRENLHQLFKSRHFFLPRAAWSIDIKRFKMPGQPDWVLMSAVDYFSSYAVVMIMRRRTVAAVVQMLDREICDRFGVPCYLTTDFAGEFGASFDAWCVQRGIEHKQPVPEYSRANGKAESFWQTVQKRLRSLRHFGDWQREIQSSVFGYNCTPKESTGLSPFEIFYGTPPNTVLANKLRSVLLQGKKYTVQERLDIMRAAWVATMVQASVHGNLTRDNTAAALNRKSRQLSELPAGKKVVYYQKESGAMTTAKAGRPRNFCARWVPATVVSRVESVYTLQPGHRPRGKVFRHRCHIKPWTGSDKSWQEQVDAIIEAGKKGRRAASQVLSETGGSGA